MVVSKQIKSNKENLEIDSLKNKLISYISELAKVAPGVFMSTGGFYK